jgi:hypothetical protein
MHSTLFWKNIDREKYDMMQDMYVQRLPNLKGYPTSQSKREKSTIEDRKGVQNI